jgi:hypothetical protein
MKSAEERVTAMVHEGKITAAEGERLLAAMRERRPTWRLLLNPFERLPAGRGLLLAGIITVCGIVVSLFGVRFDGALDVHVTGRRWSVPLALLDHGNAIASMTLALWAASLLLAKQGRLVDFLISVGVARAPLVAAGALMFAVMPPPSELAQRIMANPSDPILFLALLALPGVIWFFVLLYHGFKTASGLSGGKSASGFIGAVVVAEIVSKLVVQVVRLA